MALDKHSPARPAPYSDAELNAVKAVVQGRADADQQQRAMDWIITQAAGAYEPSFRGAATHDTAFAEGRRFVGLQIIKLANIRTSRGSESEEQP